MRPSQLYHFATPRIFRQKRAPFEPACLDTMMRVYNAAFYELSQFCLDRSDAVAAFYRRPPPSTRRLATPGIRHGQDRGRDPRRDFGADAPEAADRDRAAAPVKTDQTATIFPVPAAAPSALMLPIIRRMASA